MHEILLHPLSPNGGEGYGEGEVNHLPLQLINMSPRHCIELGDEKKSLYYLPYSPFRFFPVSPNLYFGGG
jgi:hypothetical protein